MGALTVTGAVAGLGAAAVIVASRLGRTYGATRSERAASLPGDGLVPRPQVVTDHAITIDAPPAAVWPWLVQMGWNRGGWYTAGWVDQLLFPANGPSATTIIADLQNLRVGDFIPDGPPHTRCGLIVEQLDPERALVLHSTSHLPPSWRDHAAVDWSWVFALTPVGDGRRCRFHFRSRWVTAPWWFTLGARLLLVPADFVMARDMLRGVRQRAEGLRSHVPSHPPAQDHRLEPARWIGSARSM